MVDLERLESSLRPGQLSAGGFLGVDERLEDVLNADEATVQGLCVTHEQIAARIEYFIKAVDDDLSQTGTVIDNKYRVGGVAYRGWQNCPWGDRGQYSSLDFTVENLRTGERLNFPGLIVHLIRQHRFYEGKKSPYRVDPEKAVSVLDIKGSRQETSD